MKSHRLGGGAEKRWSLEFHPKADAEIQSSPPALQSRFEAAFEALATEPRRPRPGFDVKKLSSLPAGGIYRLRVGSHRVCYFLLDADHRAVVLCIVQRGLGYDRILALALARATGKG